MSQTNPQFITKQNDKKMEYESLKSKLQKLQALVDRGEAGEAENAQRAIERLCSEYGINLDEVLDFASKRKDTFEVGRAKDMLQLFMRCLSAAVCSTEGLTYCRPTKSSIRINSLTTLEYAEVLGMFNWHKSNYKRELEEFKKTFYNAYVGKHNLYFGEERQGVSVEELSEEDIKRLRRIFAMREAMSDQTYRKQLENKQ